MADSPSPAPKKDWVITQADFDRLLQQLDPDRDEAAQKYERVRGKLTNFFRWRGCTQPEDYVDLTMDRVARKIGEGAEITARDPYLYFHGVAINVLREHWKKVEKHSVTALEELPVSQSPAENPEERREEESERLDHETRLDCLNDCVEGLPKQHLEIVTQYHQEKGGTKIAQRNELAQRLNIPLNALRIRVFRIREGLEECVTTCLQRKKA